MKDIAEKIHAWFGLLRPWSYAATLVPFLLAASAFGTEPGADWPRWLGGLAVGLLFQATVNLLNTCGDERSGVDDVPGAIRTTPQVHDGLVSMRAVLAAAAVCAALASAGGLLLCIRVSDGAVGFNLPLLAAGAVGFLGATNYATGIRFKYRGLGVPFVSFLMGPLEIFAAAALLRPDAASGCLRCADVALFLLWSLPAAALVGVIMHGNDMRDIPTDRAAGIATFASRLGPRMALAYYIACHLVPYAASAAFAASAVWTRGARAGAVMLLPMLCAPLSLRTIRTAAATYRENPACPRWRGLERASGAIHLVSGFLQAAATALWLASGGVR